MWNQIKLLSGIWLCNVLGLNEARFGKDSKKKRRIILLGCTFAILGLMLVFYISVMSYAYIRIGMTEIIPAYLLAATSLIILFYTFSRTGNVIFDLKVYEKEIPLPVKPSAIVISRFFTMYFTNVVMSCLVMLPGMGVYAWFLKPGPSFYIMTLLGIFLLPLLPITIATAAGVLILAISSRVKHKNFITILLSVLLTVGVVVISLVLSLQSEGMTEYEFSQISSLIFSQIGRSYPPALLFSEGVVNGNWGAYLFFASISLGVFIVFVQLTGWKFVDICTALSATTAKKNYVLTRLPQNSALKALFKKEIKRLFSSTLYILNTSIGYILMVVFSIGLLAMGKDKISSVLQLTGPIQDFIPLILAVMCVISPTTVSSISMEGRQWWIIQSIPVSAKTVFDSKILVNLTIALPCYAAAICLLFIAFPMSITGYVWLLVLPLLYILFTSVLGITINVKMPIFNWESEAVVVKQSASVLICMLVGFASVAVPGMLIILVPSDFRDFIYLVTSLIIAAVTAILYCINQKTILSAIN